MRKVIAFSPILHISDSFVTPNRGGKGWIFGRFQGVGAVEYMASRPSGPFVLEVIFEQREDGGLRAYCDRVPNFVLSHSDADKVLADVEPSLARILTAMYGMPVMVAKAEEVGAEAVDAMPAYMCGAAQYVGVQANC